MAANSTTWSICKDYESDCELDCDAMSLLVDRHMFESDDFDSAWDYAIRYVGHQCEGWDNDSDWKEVEDQEALVDDGSFSERRYKYKKPDSAALDEREIVELIASDGNFTYYLCHDSTEAQSPGWCGTQDPLLSPTAPEHPGNEPDSQH